MLHEIKLVVVVVLVSVLLTTEHNSAAMETTDGPSSVVSSVPKSQPLIKPPMAILLTCLLTASLLVCFFLFYFRHYPERQLALAAITGYSAGGERSFLKLEAGPGLDPAVIAAFTTFTYSAVKGVKIGQQVLECAVCLNEFYDHDTLRLLPECCHVFHRECIDEWLVLHVTCPVCRANLVPKPGQLSHVADSSSCFGGSDDDHVTLDNVINLKHGGRKLSRSYSAGRPIENVERFTLRLPTDYVAESSLKKCVRSASANYIRESNYLAYEMFGRLEIKTTIG